MTNIIFMDEGHSSKTDFAALTGVLLPLSQYGDARDLFGELLLRFQELGRWTVNREFMELHGFKMLSWMHEADDELMLEMFSRVVDIVDRLALRVYRVGGLRQEFPPPLQDEAIFLRYCWGELIRALEPVLEKELVIPVMDMVDGPRVASLSGLMTFAGQMRAVGMEKNLGIRNLENIAGEVFYADSMFSFGIQLADVVGYLRQVMDRVWLKRELSPFQDRLIGIATRLDSNIDERRLPPPNVQYGSAEIRLDGSADISG